MTEHGSNLPSSPREDNGNSLEGSGADDFANLSGPQQNGPGDKKASDGSGSPDSSSQRLAPESSPPSQDFDPENIDLSSESAAPRAEIIEGSGAGVRLSFPPNGTASANGEGPREQRRSELAAFLMSLSKNPENMPDFVNDPTKIRKLQESDQHKEEILEELSSILRDWRLKLQALGVKDSSWCLGGSMRCGHYMGPKPSRNPDEEYLNTDVVEADYRLMLSDRDDPHSESLKRRIELATGLTFKKDYDERRWGDDKPSPQSIFYGYIPLESLGGKELEMELSVQRASQWVEISEYWDKIFTPAEITLQALQRDNLREKELEYVESVRPLKKFQCDEARWRIVAGYASGRFGGNPAPDMIRDLIDDWWARERPNRAEISGLGLDATLLDNAPAQPQWVMQAQADAMLLRERASRLSS